MVAWHDAMPRAEDEHRFSCVGSGLGKASVARYGMERSGME
ncbi:hypothetical protein [Reichenbachiella sp. MALMAid0571]